MDALKAFVLGIVQGATEFLPVSSSGHLVLIQQILGFETPEVFFDICLHVGTLVAVCLVFRGRIGELFTAIFHLPSLLKTHGSLQEVYRTHEAARLIWFICIGSLPTALIGLLFHRMADQLFGRADLVGILLLINGALLWPTRKSPLEGRSIRQMTTRDAFLIGIVQGLAVLPGISRSGSTIAAALYLGIDRTTAGLYSFLLSVPAIIGALLLGSGSDTIDTSLPKTAVALGFLTAAVVGFVALKALLHVIQRGRFYWFAPYCWGAGILALVWHLR